MPNSNASGCGVAWATDRQQLATRQSRYARGIVHVKIVADGSIPDRIAVLVARPFETTPKFGQMRNRIGRFGPRAEIARALLVALSGHSERAGECLLLSGGKADIDQPLLTDLGS